MKDKKINVRVDNSISDEYDLENGTAQGSVISPRRISSLPV